MEDEDIFGFGHAQRGAVDRVPNKSYSDGDSSAEASKKGDSKSDMTNGVISGMNSDSSEVDGMFSSDDEKGLAGHDLPLSPKLSEKLKLGSKNISKENNNENNARKRDDLDSLDDSYKDEEESSSYISRPNRYNKLTKTIRGHKKSKISRNIKRRKRHIGTHDLSSDEYDSDSIEGDGEEKESDENEEDEEDSITFYKNKHRKGAKQRKARNIVKLDNNGNKVTKKKKKVVNNRIEESESHSYSSSDTGTSSSLEISKSEGDKHPISSIVNPVNLKGNEEINASSFKSININEGAVDEGKISPTIETGLNRKEEFPAKEESIESQFSSPIADISPLTASSKFHKERVPSNHNLKDAKPKITTQNDNLLNSLGESCSNPEIQQQNKKQSTRVNNNIANSHIIMAQNGDMNADTPRTIKKKKKVKREHEHKVQEQEQQEQQPVNESALNTPTISKPKNVFERNYNVKKKDFSSKFRQTPVEIVDVRSNILSAIEPVNEYATKLEMLIASQFNDINEIRKLTTLTIGVIHKLFIELKKYNLPINEALSSTHPAVAQLRDIKKIADKILNDTEIPKRPVIKAISPSAVSDFEKRRRSKSSIAYSNNSSYNNTPNANYNYNNKNNNSNLQNNKSPIEYAEGSVAKPIRRSLSNAKENTYINRNINILEHSNSNIRENGKSSQMESSLQFSQSNFSDARRKRSISSDGRIMKENSSSNNIVYGRRKYTVPDETPHNFLLLTNAYKNKQRTEEELKQGQERMRNRAEERRREAADIKRRKNVFKGKLEQMYEKRKNNPEKYPVKKVDNSFFETLYIQGLEQLQANELLREQREASFNKSGPINSPAQKRKRSIKTNKEQNNDDEITPPDTPAPDVPNADIGQDHIDINQPIIDNPAPEQNINNIEEPIQQQNDNINESNYEDYGQVKNVVELSDSN